MCTVVRLCLMLLLLSVCVFVFNVVVIVLLCVVSPLVLSVWLCRCPYVRLIQDNVIVYVMCGVACPTLYSIILSNDYSR